ncbi:MAG: HD domain-containing protein [Desulfobacteraceae bacterium]|nr:HD domain-containing protein [Desulfobacteraceae bacterium]MBU4053650.1 HD domain-containing protein [Pseudomonadota bacterium]
MSPSKEKSIGISGADQGTRTPALSRTNAFEQDTTSEILEKVQTLFENAKSSHDWDHTLRVYRLCERIGAVEGADMDVLRVAAVLHDIGRSCQDQSQGALCHAEKGAEMAAEILEDFPLPTHRKSNIIHCIASHRFRKGRTPETVEAKVLFDADKIDAIGAVGVARAYLFAGEIGARLHSPEKDMANTLPYTSDDTGYREYCVKLSKIKNRLLTHEGRKIAGKRHEFMVSFFDRFLKEVEGKDE